MAKQSGFARSIKRVDVTWLIGSERRNGRKGKKCLERELCRVGNNDVELTIRQEGTCATNGESDYLHMIQHTRVHVYGF
jgi:hypothetical protein